jgi:acyl dehydratase
MNVDVVKNWHFASVHQTYTEKDTILFALALGYGGHPTDPAELRFVYEKGLVAVPSMATALCHPGLWLADPKAGVNFKMVVNGEQSMTMHSPLPVKGRLRGEARVVDVVDKGKDKGALVVWERKQYDDDTGAHIATIQQVTMCRGDGGFAVPASAAATAKPASATAAAPDSEPDHRVDIQTLPQAALIYRLSADLNPLHADPEVARAAGFDRPILHGLATYGIAARALVQACCGNNPAGLKQLSARFSSPVFPGELIRTEIWDDAGSIRYRCQVPERNVVVISNGTAEVRNV